MVDLEMSFHCLITSNPRIYEPYSPGVSANEILMKKTQVSFTFVPDNTGPISAYEMMITTSKVQCPHNTSTVQVYHYFDAKTFGEEIKMDIFKGVRNVTIVDKEVDLDLIGNFTFCCRAVIKDATGNLFGQYSHMVIERKDLAKVNNESMEISGKTIILSLSKGPPQTKYYQILVAEGKQDNSDPEPEILKSYDNTKPGLPYIAAEFMTERFQQYQRFTVGDGLAYSKDTNRLQRNVENIVNSEYINVQLQKGTTYSIIQRAYVDERTYYSTPWITSIRTDGKSPTNTPSPKSSEGLDMTLIGAISAIVAVVIVVVLALLYVLRMRRTRQARESKYGIPMGSISNERTSDVNIGQVNPAAELDEKPNDNPLDSPPPQKVVLDHKHPPVKVIDFPNHWNKLNKDSHNGLTEEYKALKSGQQYRWNDAIKPELKSKNRYANIVAYDHSRVRLQTTPGQSDYINASFIHGYLKPNKYIASQGPNMSSVNDFWAMIWQQEVPVIVMATRLIEQTKKKCEQYWPSSDSQHYGDIVVSLSRTDTYTDYVVRIFTLKKVNCKEKREVQQYHYLTWPDHNVPEFPADILNLRHRMRKVFPVSQINKPILVHCSAGVGRTGTFISIDEMLSLANEQNKVDVFNYVNFLRTMRIHMVQTESQYRFIYRALSEAFSCGITEVNASDMHVEIKSLMRPNKEENNKTGFQLQFERLESVTLPLTAEETKAGLMKQNQDKNRFNHILPRDVNRVILPRSVYDNVDGDYINAIFVNGYMQKDAFIATQHPLPSTEVDFWYMVSQKKIVSIVMLNTLYEDDMAYQSYWPSLDETLSYDNISVTFLSEEQQNNVIARKFQLVDTKDDGKSHECKIFQYQKWPNYEVPKKEFEVIDLLLQVERQQYNNDGCPVVVMCSDGATRSGTFIAASTLMEHLKLEQLVDVFQTVKKIRSVRPQFVGNEKQYKFCYDVVMAYINSFETYSNYTE